jgi:hypothetical protein
VEVGEEVGAAELVDLDVDGHGRLFGQEVGDGRTGISLVRQGDRVVQVEDDGVRAGFGRPREALRPVAGDMQPGECHGHISILVD